MEIAARGTDRQNHRKKRDNPHSQPFYRMWRSASAVGSAMRSVLFKQRILLVWIYGHSVIAGPILIHEFDNDVLPNAVNIPVVPLLERSLICGARMRLKLIRRAVLDINPPAIGFPPRHSRRKMSICVSDSPVMLRLHLVLGRSRRRIPTVPKL